MESARLVLIDEAHRAAAPSYRVTLEALATGERDVCVVGLTATPFRAEYLQSHSDAGTKELKDIFRNIIEPSDALGDRPREEFQHGSLARPQWDAIQTSTLLKAPPLFNPENITEDDIERIDFALKKRAE